jgi:uncharacterized protein involved in exopolysaccharide biosynthesis
MAIMKVDGMKNYVFEPGQSKAAKDRRLYEAEQGIDLTESTAGDRNKALRAEMVLTALGKASSSIAALKAKANESELSESDLNPLSREIRKLKSDLKRMTVKAELQEMATNPRAVSGLKHTLREKQGIKDLEGTVLLIERFQEGELSAEKLLKELETRGIFDFK